jgi:hypothetical protein
MQNTTEEVRIRANATTIVQTLMIVVKIKRLSVQPSPHLLTRQYLIGNQRKQIRVLERSLNDFQPRSPVRVHLLRCVLGVNGKGSPKRNVQMNAFSVPFAVDLITAKRRCIANCL